MWRGRVWWRSRASWGADDVDGAADTQTRRTNTFGISVSNTFHQSLRRVPAGDSSLQVRPPLCDARSGTSVQRMPSLAQTAPLDACSDQHASCRRWAAAGNCVRLQSFMHEECAAACDRCEAAAPETEPCAAVRDAAGPGAIAQTFGRAAALEHLKPRVLSEDPFVLVFDDFASAAEAAEVASLAEDVGFEPSGSSCGYRAGGCNSASMSCLPVQGGDCWSLAATLTLTFSRALALTQALTQAFRSHAAMRRLESRMIEVRQLPSDNCEPLSRTRARTRTLLVTLTRHSRLRQLRTPTPNLNPNPNPTGNTNMTLAPHLTLTRTLIRCGNGPQTTASRSASSATAAASTSLVTTTRPASASRRTRRAGRASGRSTSS